MIHRMIRKERERVGLFGMPDFMLVIDENLKAIKKMELQNEVKQGALPMRELGIIRYDSYKTVNECLDAISDLNTLHEMFGDEAYLN